MILLEIGTRLDREVFSSVYTFKIFLKVLLRKGKGQVETQQLYMVSS